MSFNKDQMNSTIKTLQDTARSLPAGPYELIEEEDTPLKDKFNGKFELPNPPERPKRSIGEDFVHFWINVNRFSK